MRPQFLHLPFDLLIGMVAGTKKWYNRAMESKVYLDAQTYLRDSWRLARQILDSGWRPDAMLALWRGGAAVGAAVHEFLKVKGLSLRHMPVKCASYTGIGQSQTEVVFSLAENVFAALEPGAKVLVIDDVFDTGRTAAAVRRKLAAQKCEAKIACVYWKPSKNVTGEEPDFHVRKLDEWIVFPHEIEGLTPAEIVEKDPVLAEILCD